MDPQATNTPRASARSHLFVPGDRPERFDKAWASAADEVIVDLEDAVAPDRKNEARQALAQWLDPKRPVWVRVNATDTPWFDDDLRALDAPGVAGVMLPKAESVPAPLASLCERRGLGILALVETAQGLHQAGELARTPGVMRLAFGTLDFQVDLGIEGEDEALLMFRSQLVWQSRLAGLPAPLDGVSLQFDDEAALRDEALRSRRLGFGGRLCIHPRQVGAVNEAFSPSAAEREWAGRIAAALRDSGGAAVAVDGKMVDRPVWLKARRILVTPAPGMPLRLRSRE